MLPDAPHEIKLQQRQAGEIVNLMLLMSTHFVKEKPEDTGWLTPLPQLYRNLSFVTVARSINSVFSPVSIDLSTPEVGCLVEVVKLAELGRIPTWDGISGPIRPSRALLAARDGWMAMLAKG